MKKVMHIGYNHRINDIRIYKKECHSLVKDNYEVMYVTSTKNSKPDINEYYDGIKVKTIKLKYNNRFLNVISYWKDIKEMVKDERPNIFHIHEFWLVPLIPFLRRRGKVIYDSHEDIPRQLIITSFENIKFRERLMSKAIELFENFMIRKVDYIIAATPYIGDRLKKVNKNTKVVCNYPILTEKSPNINHTDIKERNLCYAGGISKSRGISSIVEAMGNISGKFLLAGDLSNEYKEELNILKGWKNVEHLGYLNYTDVQRLYSKCIVGMCLYLPEPNTYYAQPNKMFEYMEASIPIICSNYPIWQKIVEENNCGICVNPKDIKEIEEAIRFFLDNPGKAKDMGRNGRRAVEEKYNWENEEKKLLTVYRSLYN